MVGFLEGDCQNAANLSDGGWFMVLQKPEERKEGKKERRKEERWYPNNVSHRFTGSGFLHFNATRNPHALWDAELRQLAKGDAAAAAG
jgi:hypothetical protein